MTKTAEELHAEQVKEYGTFVAVEPINIGAARAFNVGDPVPVSTVESGAVPRDKVKTVTSKAGQEAVATATTEKG